MVEMTVTDWTDKIFASVYAGQDEPRSPADVWMAASAHFSGMGEHIRRMHFSGLFRKSATHAFCWLCSFFAVCRTLEGNVFHLNHQSLSEVVGLKYPRVCGHCENTRCTCHPADMDSRPNKAARYKSLLERWRHVNWHELTISDWQKEFRSIYGGQVHVLPLEVIGFHFLEEAGETAMAIRSLQELRKAPEAGVDGVDGKFLARLSSVPDIVGLYDEYHQQYGDKTEPASQDAGEIRNRLVKAKMDLVIELADTFSWFCSVLHKVKSIAENCKNDCDYAMKSFDEMLKREYLPQNKPLCPTCHASPCRCKFVQGGSA